MKDLTNGGSVTAIPDGDLLAVEVSDAAGPAMTSSVKLTPAEAVSVGVALLGWGMARPYAAAARKVAEAAAAMADALDMSERIAP